MLFNLSLHCPLPVCTFILIFTVCTPLKWKHNIFHSILCPVSVYVLKSLILPSIFNSSQMLNTPFLRHHKIYCANFSPGNTFLFMNNDFAMVCLFVLILSKVLLLSLYCLLWPNILKYKLYQISCSIRAQIYANFELSVIAHACNPGTCRIQAGASWDLNLSII